MASHLNVWATHPEGPIAQALHDEGIAIRPMEEDAGPVEHYVLASDLAVARRTGLTLLQGIEDKSLFTEAIDLGERFERVILIVEGRVDYACSAFNPQAVMVLARQRDVIDLVVCDEDAQVLWLVELKHGPLLPEHEVQLRHYLRHAAASPLLRSYLDRGYALHGLLATITPSDFVPEVEDVEVLIVDEDAVIDVLVRLRAERLNLG